MIGRVRAITRKVPIFFTTYFRRQVSTGFNISEYFLERIISLGYGSRIAIIDADGSQMSYNRLLGEVNKCAAGLRSLSLRQEDRVAIIMQDRKEFIISFLATVRLGCIALLVNPAMPSHLLVDTVTRTLCRVVITEDQFARNIIENLKGHNNDTVVVNYFDDRFASALPFPSVQSSALNWDCLLRETDSGESAGVCATTADSPCYWLCTSGTTGTPKVAMHRHIDMKLGSESYGRHVLDMSFDKPDVSFSSAPMFHAYGFGNSINFPLSYGGTVVLEPTRPLSPSRLAEILMTYRPSLFYSVPSGFNSLLQAEIAPEVFSSVRATVSAGEPLPAVVFQEFSSRYDLDILDGIGSTEASNFYCSNRMGSAKQNSCGIPLPGHDIELRNERGEVQDLTEGSRGEMFVQSPSAATGYYRDAQNSRKTFVGEYIATGDMFGLIGDGHYKYLGRIGDMFKVMGQWVSPLVIEDVILRHNDVQEVSVIGHLNESGLTEVVAFVVPTSPTGIGSNLTILQLQTSIVDLCKDYKLPSFQIPTSFCVVDKIEKNSTGKVIKYLLREEFARQSRSTSHVLSSIRVAKAKEKVRFEVQALLMQHLGSNVDSNDGQFGRHTLMALGVDSSMLTRIRNVISKEFVDIPYKLLYNKNIDDIINFVVNSHSSSCGEYQQEEVNWSQECRLPLSMVQKMKHCESSTKRRSDGEAYGVLLTGATGFLGMHILLEQLTSLQARGVIYVLVRGDDVPDSTSKLLSAAEQYGIRNVISTCCDSGRIEVVCGNLAESGLGLQSDIYSKLTVNIDVIIHNGATVNWLLDYSSLRATNVGGTVELLNMCTVGVKKRFVYVGSIGAFLPGEEAHESHNLDVKPTALNAMYGYGASKRISENLVVEAMEYGLDGYICRPGTIGGSSQSGSCNPSDTINRFLMSICQLGAAPVHPQGCISILPVDTVAAVISRLALASEKSSTLCLPRRCTIVGNPVPMKDIVSACSSVCGRMVKEIPLPDYKEMVRQTSSALYPVASFFSNEGKLPLGDETHTHEHENYLTMLKELDITAPGTCSRSLIGQYLENLMSYKHSREDS